MRPPLLAERYQLEHLIGRGGMAEVWRGHDLRLERAVAVKIVNQGGLTDPATLERFHREAVTVAKMAHPNIVAGFDFGAEDGRPYLVMELVEGQTLDELLARGPLPLADVTRIASQLCAALEAAHGAGVIHRDIKPGNLLITPDGTVKVLDFGIARLTGGAQAALTRTATVVGTSYYMAPEQASGGAVDVRTDLYAVGCVLYAMLTGAPPFEGENPMGVLYQHLHSAPPPVAERRPEVPAALASLVAALLAKRPEERPESAAAVRTRLSGQSGHTSVMPTVAGGAAAGGFAGRAAVPPPTEPDADFYPPGDGPRHGSRPAPRGWAMPAAIGAVVLALLVLLVALTLLPDDEQPGQAQPSAQVNESARPSPTPTPSPTADDPAGRLAELRGALNQQIEAGAVDAEAAKKLNELLDKVGEEIGKGKLTDAAKHLAEFQDKVDEFAGKGQVSESAQDELDRYADRLAQKLPPPENGEDDGGDGEDGNKGKGNGKGKGKKDD